MPKQIFGRQPVVWIALIQAVAQMLAVLDLLTWAGINTAADVTLFAAVLNAAAAVYLALGTTETALAPAVELLKAVAAVLVWYGLDFGPDKQALAIGVITAAFAAWHQPKTSPTAELTVDSSRTHVLAA